jgi:hypothetical protein
VFGPTSPIRKHRSSRPGRATRRRRAPRTTANGGRGPRRADQSEAHDFSRPPRPNPSGDFGNSNAGVKSPSRAFLIAPVRRSRTAPSAFYGGLKSGQSRLAADLPGTHAPPRRPAAAGEEPMASEAGRKPANRRTGNVSSNISETVRAILKPSAPAGRALNFLSERPGRNFIPRAVCAPRATEIGPIGGFPATCRARTHPRSGPKGANRASASPYVRARTLPRRRRRVASLRTRPENDEN